MKRFPRIFIVFIFAVSVGSAAVSAPTSGVIDLYRVDVRSQSDADILTGHFVDVFFRVAGGYLVLATSESAARLSASGLHCRRIAENVDRGHLALDTRRDQLNVEKYPTVFAEEGIRILRVDNPDAIGARGNGLAPIHTENIPVVVTTPATLSRAAIPSDTLDLLLDRVIIDTVQAELEALQAFDGRLSGTASDLASATWLKQQFIDFGYDSVVFDPFSYEMYSQQVQCRNVIAYKIGREHPYNQIVVGAHFDAVEFSPGADDNGSSVAGVLEIARALADIDTRHTFIFVLFDGEEDGLHGSWHYVQEASARGDRIDLMLNMDMIGHYENDLEAYMFYFIEKPTFALLWAALADSIPSIHITATAYGLSQPGGSDHAPFLQYGYDAIFANEYIFSTVYHSPHDSTVYLNYDYLARMIKASLATAYVVDRQYSPERELDLAFVDGAPDFIVPNTATTLDIRIREIGGAEIIPGSVQLNYAIDGGETTAIPMSSAGGDIYTAAFPSVPCLTTVSYLITAEDNTLGTVTLPASGDPLRAVSATGIIPLFEDDFGTDRGWTVAGDAFDGQWVRMDPADGDGGWYGAPVTDYDGNKMCYITDGDIGHDVDIGTTSLISPPIDASSGDVIIEYARWYSNNFSSAPYSDVFTVYVSNNAGHSWTLVEVVGPSNQASGSWYTNRFWLSQYVPPSSDVRIRFDASDYGDDSQVEAGVDAVKFLTYSTQLQVITDDIPDWTTGQPMAIQLVAGLCEGTATWTDRLNQLAGTGLTLSTDGLLSGIPTRVAPVLFRANVIDGLGGMDEKVLEFIIYDSLRITTVAVPPAVVDHAYEFQIVRSGGTGVKTWSDRDDDLAGSGIALSSKGVLSGIPIETGSITFTARVIDEVGAAAEKEFTLSMVSAYVCGDASGDSTVSIADAVYLINYIFKGGPAPDPICQGDGNGDEDINIGDAVYLITYIFQSGPPPVEPCCP